MFLPIMGIMITALIVAIIVGEDRFNSWVNKIKESHIRCNHEYKCYDKDGKIDNVNPAYSKCVKCGKKEKIEE